MLLWSCVQSLVWLHPLKDLTIPKKFTPYVSHNTLHIWLNNTVAHIVIYNLLTLSYWFPEVYDDSFRTMMYHWQAKLRMCKSACAKKPGGAHETAHAPLNTSRPWSLSMYVAVCVMICIVIQASFFIKVNFTIMWWINVETKQALVKALCFYYFTCRRPIQNNVN